MMSGVSAYRGDRLNPLYAWIAGVKSVPSEISCSDGTRDPSLIAGNHRVCRVSLNPYRTVSSPPIGVGVNAMSSALLMAVGVRLDCRWCGGCYFVRRHRLRLG